MYLMPMCWAAYMFLAMQLKMFAQLGLLVLPVVLFVVIRSKPSRLLFLISSTGLALLGFGMAGAEAVARLSAASRGSEKVMELGAITTGLIAGLILSALLYFLVLRPRGHDQRTRELFFLGMALSAAVGWMMSLVQP